MALIKCPECGREVSKEAFTCPNCGHPLRGQASTNSEKTRKKFKVLQMVAVLLFLLGAYLIIKGLIGNGLQDLKFWFGVSVEFIALVFALIGKFGAWWNNNK